MWFSLLEDSEVLKKTFSEVITSIFDLKFWNLTILKKVLLMEESGLAVLVSCSLLTLLVTIWYSQKVFMSTSVEGSVEAQNRNQLLLQS